MGEYSTGALDSVFAALADPTRRAIMASLAHGPATISEIAEPFPVSFNAISKHVMALERAGLISREIRGRQHLCTLQLEPLHKASAWLDYHRQFWGERVDALERHLTQQQKPHKRRRR